MTFFLLSAKRKQIRGGGNYKSGDAKKLLKTAVIAVAAAFASLARGRMGRATAAISPDVAGDASFTFRVVFTVRTIQGSSMPLPRSPIFKFLINPTGRLAVTFARAHGAKAAEAYNAAASNRIGK
jgi:hypothetical protein